MCILECARLDFASRAIDRYSKTGLSSTYGCNKDDLQISNIRQQHLQKAIFAKQIPLYQAMNTSSASIR